MSGLTEAQVRQLAALGAGLSVTCWGGKPRGKLPGTLTLHRLRILETKGAVRSTRETAFRYRFELTDASRRALSGADHDG